MARSTYQFDDWTWGYWQDVERIWQLEHCGRAASQRDRRRRQLSHAAPACSLRIFDAGSAIRATLEIAPAVRHLNDFIGLNAGALAQLQICHPEKLG